MLKGSNTGIAVWNQAAAGWRPTKSQFASLSRKVSCNPGPPVLVVEVVGVAPQTSMVTRLPDHGRGKGRVGGLW